MVPRRTFESGVENLALISQVGRARSGLKASSQGYRQVFALGMR